MGIGITWIRMAFFRMMDGLRLNLPIPLPVSYTHLPRPVLKQDAQGIGSADPYHHFGYGLNGVSVIILIQEMGQDLCIGVEFISQTDTEVLAHLLDKYYNGNPIETISKMMVRIRGSYALGILFKARPGEILSLIQL